MAARYATLKDTNAGRTIVVVGDVCRFLATGTETEGKYTQFVSTVLPGRGPPPHVHHREEEGFFVLEGEITFQIGEDRIVATAGMFANMPIGTPHAFKNETDRPARMIITLAPAGLEEMFFEIGQEMQPGVAASPPSKAEIEKLIAAAPRYGIELLPPKH